MAADEVHCGCAAHPDGSGAPPPGAKLKAFLEEGDSLYDATSYLCLGCGALWAEVWDQVEDSHTWRTVGFDRLQVRSGWQLGLEDVWPGDAVMADEGRFQAWVRALDAPVWTYGMV